MLLLYQQRATRWNLQGSSLHLWSLVPQSFGVPQNVGDFAILMTCCPVLFWHHYWRLFRNIVLYSLVYIPMRICNLTYIPTFCLAHILCHRFWYISSQLQYMIWQVCCLTSISLNLSGWHIFYISWDISSDKKLYSLLSLPHNALIRSMYNWWFATLLIQQLIGK